MPDRAELRPEPSRPSQGAPAGSLRPLSAQTLRVGWLGETGTPPIGAHRESRLSRSALRAGPATGGRIIRRVLDHFEARSTDESLVFRRCEARMIQGVALELADGFAMFRA